MSDYQELDGPALAAAVAWVLMPEPKGDGDVLLQDGTCYAIWDMEGDMCEWRPDLGGADAWEVVEWVRAHGCNVVLWTEHGRRGCLVETSDTCEPRCQRTGDTDAIALCRAVVAMGAAE